MMFVASLAARQCSCAASLRDNQPSSALWCWK